MKPVNFEGANKRIRHRPNRPMWIQTNGKTCKSKWKLTMWERIKLLFTGAIWIESYSGGNQPKIEASV